MKQQCTRERIYYSTTVILVIRRAMAALSSAEMLGYQSEGQLLLCKNNDFGLEPRRVAFDSSSNPLC